MITKIEYQADWDGERALVNFAHAGGGAAGLAVKRNDGWHYYDATAERWDGRPPLLSAEAFADPIDAAIQSLLSRRVATARTFRELDPSAESQARYAEALHNDPMPAPVAACCHYCGQEIGRDAAVNTLGVYQCKQCS